MSQEKSSKRAGDEEGNIYPKKAKNGPVFWAESKRVKLSIDRNIYADEQKILQEYLYELLFDSLCKCRLIAKKEVCESSIFENDNLKTLLQSATIAGGLIPVIGQYSIATALITSALFVGVKEINLHTSVKRAKRINDCLNGPDDLIETCKYLSSEIPQIYADSITKLNLAGKHRFAQCAVFCMLHYIATDEGKESTYFSSTLHFIAKSCLDFGKSIGRLFDPEKFPSNDPRHVPLKTRMLNALLVFQPNVSERTKLEHKPEIKPEDYYFEGILTTGIKTSDGKIINTPDSQSEKYGYRVLSNEYAQQLASCVQKSQSCVIS